MLRRTLGLVAARLAAGGGASCSGRTGASNALAGGVLNSLPLPSTSAPAPTSRLPFLLGPPAAPARAFWAAAAACGRGGTRATPAGRPPPAHASLTRPGGGPATIAGPKTRLLPPASLGPSRSASTSQKQTRSAGRKMKTVSSWKRRFKRTASTLAPGGAVPLIVRHHAGHAHRRTRKPPHVRRRLRAAAPVDPAWALMMKRRGFVRTNY